jgi:ABC-2 type transport system permease protein
MLVSVLAKTLRDNWRGWVIAIASLSALLLLSMWAYREVDLGFYTSLPEVYRSMLGIPENADVASLAINAHMGSYGAMTIAAMALGMGAASIAGEERAGTIALLLANPRSRTHVLASKGASMVLLVALGVLALWGAISLTAQALGISIAGLDVGALSLHLFISSLFYGFLAMAVGAWTGNQGAAAGVAVGVMLVSFVAVGVLPLLEGAEDFVRAFPWYYFNGGDPLLNGVSWSHIGVLVAACAVFAAGALIGVNRRDLKGQSVGVTLVDRLRANPFTGKVIGRLAGSARVSSIWAKTAAEYQWLLAITAVYTFLVQGVMLGPMYAAIPEDLLTTFSDFPEVMLALFGGGDISTAEGFYQIETFGMMAPVVVMVVTIAIGAGALAGEESRRTMGLLLANPIKRSRVVLEKTRTMMLFAFLVGFVTFAGVALGSVLGGLGIDTGHIAATCLLQTLVGLVFGALALALSAGTGRKNVAIFGAVGAGICLHVLNGLAELNETMANWAKLSPFYYYLGNDPLNNGMDWSHAAVLAGIVIALIALSLVLFQRRDLRQTG